MAGVCCCSLRRRAFRSPSIDGSSTSSTGPGCQPATRMRRSRSPIRAGTPRLARPARQRAGRGVRRILCGRAGSLMAEAIDDTMHSLAIRRGCVLDSRRPAGCGARTAGGAARAQPGRREERSPCDSLSSPEFGHLAPPWMDGREAYADARSSRPASVRSAMTEAFVAARLRVRAWTARPTMPGASTTRAHCRAGDTRASVLRSLVASAEFDERASGELLRRREAFRATRSSASWRTRPSGTTRSGWRFCGASGCRTTSSPCTGSPTS